MVSKSTTAQLATAALGILMAVAPLSAFAATGYGASNFVIGGGGVAGVGGGGPAGGIGGLGGQVLGAAVYNFTANFGYGTDDEDVTQLQTILIADGYLKIAAPTGWFGPLTQAAVKEYQAANDISPVTGYVGPLTRAVLNQGSIPTNG